MGIFTALQWDRTLRCVAVTIVPSNHYREVNYSFRELSLFVASLLWRWKVRGDRTIQTGWTVEIANDDINSREIWNSTVDRSGFRRERVRSSCCFREFFAKYRKLNDYSVVEDVPYDENVCLYIWMKHWRHWKWYIETKIYSARNVSLLIMRNVAFIFSSK